MKNGQEQKKQEPNEDLFSASLFRILPAWLLLVSHVGLTLFPEG